MKRLLFALLLVNVALPAAQAQYPPGYRPPVYVNPYYPIGSPGYNRLNGQADVMRAQGDLINANEQARIVREQANQAKIDTKRKAFDEMLYEKANTPTYLESLTQDKQQFLTRIMSYPTRLEITEGKSLNTMLPYLQSLTTSGSQGPPVTLPKFAVSGLSVTVGAQGNVGILGKKGPLEWPVALRGPQQKKLDNLIPAAVDATIDGSLDAKMLKNIRTEMNAMKDQLRKQYMNEEIEGTSYSRGMDYFETLTTSINALERPDAKKQLAGAATPKAGNVQELIEFMTDNGLSFAPALPGNEAAYQVVHDAFVRYGRTAQSSGGFTSMNAPVSSGGKK